MWDEFVDLISRPQQAVMGFAKEGSDQLGKTNQWISEKGYDPGYFGVPAMWSTIPAGLSGAWKGLTGQKDYNDWNLAEGATDNPKIDSAINTGVRAIADPVAAVPFGGQSQRLGTMARTAGNLWDARKYSPEAYGALTNNGIWNALKMDISHGGGGNLPVVIRGEGNVKPIGQQLGYPSSNPNPFSGFISPDSRFMMVDVTQAKPSWLHEFVHDTTKRFIDRQEARNAYKAFYDAVGQGTKQRIARTYPDLVGNLPKLGEELYAIMTKEGTPGVLNKILGKVNETEASTLKYIGDMAQRRLAQVNTGAANPLSYNMNPSAIRALSNIWDSE